jgi:hypothetical protein
MGPAGQRLVRAAAGPGIRSPAPGPGAGPGSEKRWGAPRAAHPGRGVVALGDDNGNPPADAGQWAPCALGHVVVHHSSLVAAPNLAAPRAPATPANKTITMIFENIRDPFILSHGPLLTRSRGRRPTYHGPAAPRPRGESQPGSAFVGRGTTTPAVSCARPSPSLLAAYPRAARR